MIKKRSAYLCGIWHSCVCVCVSDIPRSYCPSLSVSEGLPASSHRVSPLACLSLPPSLPRGGSEHTHTHIIIPLLLTETLFEALQQVGNGNYQ